MGAMLEALGNNRRSFSFTNTTLQPPFHPSHNENKTPEPSASSINHLCNLPSDIFRCSICQFLLPYEQFAFTRICKYFHNLLSINNYSFKYHSIRDRNVWHEYIQIFYAESGGWLLFKNHTIDKLSKDERLCLMYFIIYYDQILYYQTFRFDQHLQSKHKRALKLKQIIPQNINHLRIISSTNTSKLVTRLICNILRFCSSTNPINAIYIERCNLNDTDVNRISYALVERQSESNLRGFSIGYNENITDKYIALLFDVISRRCPSLKLLGLHATNISNKTCRIIFEYYAQQKNNNRDGIVGVDKCITLEKLYLMRNSGITEIGIDILNEIFVKKYLDENRLEHEVIINCARCGLKQRKDYWNRIIRI